MKIKNYLRDLRESMEDFKKSLANAQVEKSSFDSAKKSTRTLAHYFYDCCKDGNLLGVQRVLGIATADTVNGYDLSWADRGLESAISNNHLDIVKYLMDSGLGIGKRSNSGWNLVNACGIGNKEMVEYLLTKYDIHFCMDAALQTAGDHNHDDIVDLLINKYDKNYLDKLSIEAPHVISILAKNKNAKVRKLVEPYSHIVMGNKFGIFDDED